jgi:hypothetical protein
MDRVTMCSQLSPFIASCFIEDYEEVALSRAAYRPTYWFCYVNDTFLISPHGPEEMNDFLNHLNNIHPNIQSTMQTEGNSHLPFLDTDIYRNQMAPLGILCRGSLPTPIYIWMLSHMSIQPVSILCYLPWYTELGPYATTKVSQEKWNSFVVRSERMATLTGRSIVFFIHLTGRIHLERIWHWWPTCPLLDQPTASAVC